MRVVAGLFDTPYMRHEVARKRHENAECGSVVGVAEQRNHALIINEWEKVLLTLISFGKQKTISGGH